nr:AAA family ATPase [Pontibacterium sinense]
MVLNVVREYANQSGFSYLDIRENFLDISNAKDVVLDEVAYQTKLEKSIDVEKRYFLSDPVLDVDGQKFYVSNQWGRGNINGFILRAREMGMDIKIIADENSELIRLFTQYKSNPRTEWINSYRNRCQSCSEIDVGTFDFTADDFLENYWRSASNGISGVQPGMLSTHEFTNLKKQLPDISRKIINNPSAETYKEIIKWAKKAKEGGLFTSVKHGVINRFFCACAPDLLCTILNLSHLQNFISKWNEKKYGANVDSSGNWFDLNAGVMKDIRMCGLEEEDDFLVNTFVYSLKEYLLDGAPEPGTNVQTALIYPPTISGSVIKPSSGLTGINQILYGPPGTGKTYSTIEKAVSIADPALVKSLSESALPANEVRLTLKGRFDQLLQAGQIVFTTFHQSFSYEDFVEGLKAESNGGQISYSVEDGLFKKICERADPVRYSGGLDEAIAQVKELCSEEPLRLLTATGKRFSVSYRGGKTFSCLPEASMEQRELPANIDHVKKVALGEIPENLYCGSYVKSIAKYVYDTYNIDKGVTSDSVEASPHVLIIDEINRGNISRIFGELITLLEPGKRKGQAEALSVTLPYSKEEFSIPANLHVIGTMNTADTSLAKIDIALRRRFQFVEVMPDMHQLRGVVVAGIDVRLLLKTINQRIELFYDRDHTIGHSYFMGLSSSSGIDDLATIFKTQIIPLLEEYFFEDWAIIHRVLGDHLKNKKHLQFIVQRHTDQTMRRLMGANWKADTNIQSVWKLNSEALKNADAYIGIYSPASDTAAKADN